MRRKYEQVLTSCNLFGMFFSARGRRSLGALFVVFCCASVALAQTSPGGDLDEFFRSVTDGRIEIVRQGLAAHPDWANAELFLGIRPIYRASVLGRDEVLSVLLAAGADVNATTDRGTHALHAAAQQGHATIVERLLAAGATVDVANDAGQTPLFFAVRFGHREIAEALLARGASVQATDSLGRTPLHYAAGLGRLNCVSSLVENGAALDPVDDGGFTPLGLARTWKRNQFEQVDQLLSGRGARDLRPEQAWQPREEEAESAPELPATPGEGGAEGKGSEGR